MPKLLIFQILRASSFRFLTIWLFLVGIGFFLKVFKTSFQFWALRCFFYGHFVTARCVKGRIDMKRSTFFLCSNQEQVDVDTLTSLTYRN